MTKQPHVGQGAPDMGTASSEAMELVEAYCAQRSAGVALEPEDWLRAHGGDASIGDELRIIDLLREASSIAEDRASVDTTHCWAPATPSGTLVNTRLGQAILQPGELLDGKLRILDQLGAGGMGEVYVAWHEVLEREVAVKVLIDDHATDESSIGRFRKSIAAQARISSHQHIVGTLDAGIHRGHVFLVMEYVPGADLAAILQARHPLPWQEVCDWMRQAAVGLEHAHRAGLVHRDIKPGNLIRAHDGTIKLLDWGLARAESIGAGDADDGRTAANVALGTFDFMAPEQARDAATADARSDLYSLGCTFYQLLTGRAPFGHHRSRSGKLQAHGSEAPPPLRTLRDDVPPSVQAVVARLLEKDPARRYSAARELADELAAILKGDSPRRRRHGLLPAVLVGLVLLLGVVAWQLVSRLDSEINESATWERLELFTAADPTDKSQSYDPVHAIIRDGHQQPASAIRSFDGIAAFRFEGRFKQPTVWAVVWIDDSVGNEDGVQASQPHFHVMATGSGEEFSYPTTNLDANFIPVTPSATPGVHDVVLVLVAGRDGRSPNEATEGWLAEQLKGLASTTWPGPPASVESGVWTTVMTEEVGSELRSPGQQVEGDTARSYLQSIESRLPPGVRPLAAFFVRTEPTRPEQVAPDVPVEGRQRTR